MKIDGHHPAREVQGSGGHHAHKAKHAEKAAATSTTAAATTEQAVTTVSLTSEAAAADTAPQTADSGRKVPPGLARVAARFESLGEAGRTQGQSNALAQIQRHLQRYADVQELAPPASSPGSTPPVAPIADPLIVAPTDPIAVPVDGAAEGDVAGNGFAAGNGAAGDTAVAVGEDAASKEPLPAN